MHNRLHLLVLVLFPALLLAHLLPAQVSDAQFWENVNVEHKLTRDLTARFSHEGRFTDNDSRLTYFFEDAGLEYKFPKTHFGILADYVYIRKHVLDDWSNRHQYYTALTYAQKFGAFQLHDRQMLMGQVKDVYSSETGKLPEWYLRNKLTVKYNFNFYWSVYAAEEAYWHVNAVMSQELHFNRMRYFVGGFYRPNKHNEFELYYLVEQHMHVSNANHNYVLGVGYTLSI